MSLATGIAIGSAIAASAQEAARRSACRAIEVSFVNHGSDIAARTQFADCVHLLHPDDLSSGSRMVLKILLVLFFALWAGSAIYFKKTDSWNSWLDSAFYGIAAALAVYCVGAFLLLAVLFMFS